MKRRIVLYNPQSVFYTMPLALIAVGSRLDRTRYDVRIVDARLETDPLAALLREADGALCVGMTVLTGAPIRDALRATRALRERYPRLPVIWGGWHPSLFPAATLDEAGVDAVVTAQGEDALAEIVERLASASALDGIAGVHAAGHAPGPLRPLRDLNELPQHDYGLIPVARYFELKRQRQIDYISSQGCRFRCAFCADPFVYNRAWSGIEPGRMGEELAALAQRWAMEDVNFQDETFFTSTKRVAAIAEEILRRGLRFSWAATMRADQGQRLDEQVLADCRRAGLRRVMIGIEAGEPEMLKRIRKDITLPQVFESAEKCLRQGIGATFNLIVGFPGESPEAVAASLDIGKRLRAMSPDFELAIFYYKPYPGNPLAEALRQDGYSFPQTLEEWAVFDYIGTSSPWISPETVRRVDRFRFYQRIGWARSSPMRAPLQAVARWRCRQDAYALPVEKLLVEALRPSIRLS